MAQANAVLNQQQSKLLEWRKDAGRRWGAHQQAQYSPSEALMRQALRKKFDMTLVQLAQNEGQPPFTISECIAIALLYNEDRHLESCLSSLFPYFRRIVNKDDGATNELRSRISEALDSHDMPVTAIISDPNETRYRLQLEEADVYLGRLLKTERKGVFPFLELPAELRNRIYEEVLKFSKPLQVTTGTLPQDQNKVRLRTRKSVDQVRGTWLHPTQDPFETTIPITEILKPFHTCKQMHTESMSVFYGSNRFVFPNLPTLHLVFCQLDVEQVKLLKFVEVYLEADRNFLAHVLGMRQMLQPVMLQELSLNNRYESSALSDWLRAYTNGSEVGGEEWMVLMEIIHAITRTRCTTIQDAALVQAIEERTNWQASTGNKFWMVHEADS